MKKLAIFILGILVLGTSGALSSVSSPEGIWESETGDSRFHVSLCGDGTELCARLTWLREDVQTKENVAYLNKLVLEGAKPTGPNSWKGTVDVYGETATGSITAVDENTLRLTGCQLMMCQSMDFVRVSAPVETAEAPEAQGA